MWMNEPILTIDATMLQVRSKEVIAQIKAGEVVVVDESGSRIGMIPLYARAPRGLRAYDQVIRSYGRNVTILASMSIKGMQASMTIEGAVDEAVIKQYIENHKVHVGDDAFTLDDRL